jgi:hypothetical protein
MRLFESERITMVVAVFGAFLTIDMTLIIQASFIRCFTGGSLRFLTKTVKILK